MLIRKNTFTPVLMEELKTLINNDEGYEIFTLRTGTISCFEGVFSVARLGSTISVVAPLHNFRVQLLRTLYVGGHNVLWEIHYTPGGEDTRKKSLILGIEEMKDELEYVEGELLLLSKEILIDYLLRNPDVMNEVNDVPSMDTLSTYMSHMHNIKFRKEHWVDVIYPAFIKELNSRKGN